VHGRVGGRVSGCAGAFQTATHQIERNPACGWFNVYLRAADGKWIGVVGARGVYLRTSPHAEAWQAAVELEWLLDRWCHEHGACGAVFGAACTLCHRVCARVGADVPRSELVTNLPQLQAMSVPVHGKLVVPVNAEGRVVVPVDVLKMPKMPAPVLPGPTPLVRVGRAGIASHAAPSLADVPCWCAGAGGDRPH
jgi:hypothetical protein